MITPEILNEKLDDVLSRVWTGLLGRIESYNKPKQTAKVTPLLKVYGVDSFIQLPTVDDLFVNVFYSNGVMIIPDYKKGDLVYLAPNIHSISDAAKGNATNAKGTRHGLENMMVLGGIPKRPLTLPTGINKSGLVIAHESGTMIAQFDSNAILLKAGNVTPEKAVLGEKTKAFLLKFVNAFKDNATAATTNAAVGAPCGLAPAIVTKLTELITDADNLLSDSIKHN